MRRTKPASKLVGMPKGHSSSRSLAGPKACLRSDRAHFEVAFSGSLIKRDAARVMLFGLPFEESPIRKGASKGPEAIRDASQYIDHFSPFLNRSLNNLSFFDDGDLTAKTLAKRVPAGVHPIFLGGDQSISVAAVKTLADRGENFDLIHLDARPDSLDSFQGNRQSARCAIRRIKDFFRGDIYQLGIRSADAQEYAYATEANKLYPADRFVEGLAAIEKQCQGKNIYVSFNMNVMDPSLCPGVADPVSGGFLPDQVRLLIHTLKEFNVVGMDLTGVAPAWDRSGLTAVVAAEIARDCMLAFWG